MKTRWKVLL